MQYPCIPTIDIFDRKAVLVKNGKIATVLGDPFKQAERASICPVIQVVDLNAALNTGEPNTDIILQLAEKYACYVGGGIRTMERARMFLDASARRVTITSTPELIPSLPHKRTVLALDVDEELNILAKGRTEKIPLSDYSPYIPHVDRICITFHNLEGTDEATVKHFENIKERLEEGLSQDLSHVRIIVAGGVGSRDTLGCLWKQGLIPQLGKQLWSGATTFGKIYCQFALSHSNDGTMPCVIQRDTGTLLGVCHSSGETIQQSVNLRRLVLYSKSRGGQIWVKGETSGNYQDIVGVDFTCDCLLYTSPSPRDPE